jgi:hypothetical protein
MKEISNDNTADVGGGLSFPIDYPVPCWPPGGPGDPFPIPGEPGFPPGFPPGPRNPWPIFETLV